MSRHGLTVILLWRVTYLWLRVWLWTAKTGVIWFNPLAATLAIIIHMTRVYERVAYEIKIKIQT